jgi:hypothetical protein
MEAMQIDLINLTILWALGLVAVTVALNAKGAARITISFFIAVIILGMGGFFTTLKLTALKDDFAMQSTPPQKTEQPVAIPEAPQPDPESLAVAQLLAEKAQEEEAIAEYKKVMRPLLGQGKSLASAIYNFRMGDLRSLSDTEYESLQNKAMNLRTRSTSLSRRVKNSQTPASMVPLQQSINSAAEKLRLAGYSLHRFFNAENTEEEASMRAQFRNQSQSALAGFNAAENSLQ